MLVRWTSRLRRASRRRLCKAVEAKTYTSRAQRTDAELAAATRGTSSSMRIISSWRHMCSSGNGDMAVTICAFVSKTLAVRNAAVPRLAQRRSLKNGASRIIPVCRLIVE